jgi:toxin ParE1/3/4
MSLAVVRSLEAEGDLTDVVDHLSRRDAATALRFVDAVETACGKLAEQPYLGGEYETSNPRLEGLRVRPVPGFLSYLLFYRVTSTALELVRVLHGARDLDNL